MMKPYSTNFCAGAFPEWLEVMLWPTCNGRCSWCIERDGYHPTERVSTGELILRILDTGKSHIILLGGEPTLCPDVGKVISALANMGKEVYLTTNGSMLTPDFVRDVLMPLDGLNISIHHYNSLVNCGITGILLCNDVLKDAISIFSQKTKIRLNCNLIKGQIDSFAEVRRYISFAKYIGADGVRFAELKDDKNHWVSMTEIFGHEFGVNNDPFGLGCIHDVRIDDFPVNLRQMCGLQTPLRKRPENPEQVGKQVLYYDGQLYTGWQRKEVTIMDDKELYAQLVRTLDELKELISRLADKSEKKNEKNSFYRQPKGNTGGDGCCY